MEEDIAFLFLIIIAFGTTYRLTNNFLLSLVITIITFSLMKLAYLVYK